LFNSVKPSKNERYRVNKTIKRKQMDVAHLSLGMHVVELDRPWSDSPFLFQGFYIESQKDIQMIQDCCDFVYIEVTEEEWVEQKAHNKSKTVRRTRYAEKHNLASEISDANRTYQAAKSHIKLLFSSVQLGQALSTKDTQSVVSECVNKVMQNPNAILWLTRLKNCDDYTAEHSINVSLLAIALGRHMGMDKWELENLGICALLHDIGKMNVADEILNKPSALNAEEFAEMAKHTLYARKLLMERSDIYPGAVDVAYNHHERLDGRGYPRGIDASKISMFTRIVTIVDAYDAMTSDRCYKSGMSSLDALRIINKHKGTQFDAEAAQKFIAMIGLYPPGYLMEMTNGEVGIILSHDKGFQLRPKVIMVLDRDKQPQPESIINLAQYPEDIEGQRYETKAVFRSGTYGINVGDYINKGLKIKGFDYSMLSD
jgi:HD-GYP domain-containing protein (c-di-GMP phosphodiesterase class II)